MEWAESLKVFLWAMTPVGELRIAIPLGLTVYQLSPANVYFFAVLGNICVVFLLLTFLGAFSRRISRNIYFLHRLFSWFFARTRKSHYDRVNKYGLYILPFFVAIPLPATGGWTAVFIAFVFGMPFKKAFPLIIFGILVGGLIVLFLTQAGIAIEKNFGWQMLIAIVLILGLIYFLYKNYAKN